MSERAGAGSGSSGSRPLVLVGFMGAGKSRVGMAAAHRLRLPFIDTDALICEQMGPIDEIFARGGEEAFRRVERDVVVTVLDKLRRLPSVAALGGGAVLHPDVRAAARRLPYVIVLTAPVEVMYERAHGTGRPLATSADAFAALFASRQALYDEIASTTVVNDGSRSLDEVVDEVVAAVTAADARKAVGEGEQRP